LSDGRMLFGAAASRFARCMRAGRRRGRASPTAGACGRVRAAGPVDATPALHPDEEALRAGRAHQLFRVGGENIWITGAPGVKDRAALKKQGITHILNMIGEVCGGDGGACSSLVACRLHVLVTPPPSRSRGCPHAAWMGRGAPSERAPRTHKHTHMPAATRTPNRHTLAHAHACTCAYASHAQCVGYIRRGVDGGQEQKLLSGGL